MARYIDADALIKEMKECKYANPCNDYQRGVNASIDIQITGIKHIPGADVVPRSEVERVYYNLQAVLEERAETKQEIAREIFEEIEKILKSWRVEMVGNEFYHKSLVDKSIAELKKEIHGGREMKYCPKCKHFIYCDPYKMVFYAGCTAEKCPEYEEQKGGVEDAGSKVRDEH